MSGHKRSVPVTVWVIAQKERLGWQKAAVALANKNARILRAVMTKGLAFEAQHVSVKPGITTSNKPALRLHHQQTVHHAADDC